MNASAKVDSPQIGEQLVPVATSMNVWKMSVQKVKHVITLRVAINAKTMIMTTTQTPRHGVRMGTLGTKADV